MSNTIKFSVVIPAYNAAPFIEKALDSVRNQSYPAFEVLITDDGSKDDTGEVVRRYAEKHPSFPVRYARQENKGIGGARNNGLFRAAGDFIAFLDADDLWYPAKLEKIAQFALQNRTLDVIYHDEVETSSDGSKRILHYHALRDPVFEHLLFVGNQLSTSATSVRRELAQSISGFSESPEFNSAEDYEFWLRLAKAGARFGHLSEVLGEYLRVEGCVTSRIEYHHGNVFNVVSHHLDQLSQEKAYPDSLLRRVYKARRGQNRFILGMEYCKLGEFKRAWNNYLEALALRPFWWKTYAALLQLLLKAIRG
ncbi:glycosyltransferase family 2 protein [Geomonas subterranea]|uniref:glycosyltransferase family 2 protein n=1 Tax=Geomonas subterranea TaxID=2847989 RepID=UPI001CD67DD1|nr:glycosyltransferase [Geomonas fuzhouensis]